MNIVETQYSEIGTLRAWFPDKTSSYNWCGPGLRYPFTNESFLEDIHLGRMPTYSAHDEQGQFIGFGQYYEKVGRCHLARLVVSPLHRSMGIGHEFIAQLMSTGMAELSVSECSLFVVSSNKKALRCYESLNFKKSDYPPHHKHYKDIDFMVSKIV